MRSTGFAIGNGLSREGFDLNRLRGYGVTVGCNQLYKQFRPNYMVAIDPNMLSEVRAEQSVMTTPWRVITRDVFENEFWITVDNRPIIRMKDINNGFINNGGLLATSFLAEILKVDALYMIGIDFFLPTPGRPNNIFGYNRRQGPGIENVWNTLPERNPDTKFYRVGEISDADRPFYETKLKGFEYIESFDLLPVRCEFN